MLPRSGPTRKFWTGPKFSPTCPTTEISPQVAQRIKNDIILCISKYINIDEKELEVELTQMGEPGQAKTALVANIPILGVKKK